MNRWLDFFIGVPLVKLFSFFSKKSPSIQIKKLLIIKLAAVGDTILLIPMLRVLRQSDPNLQIDWLVSSINQSIAKTVPYVNEVIVWERKSFAHLPMLISRLRREKYDAVIDLEQWARGTALISFFTGAPLRAGFNTPGQHRHALYTHTYKKEYNQHEIKDFFGLTRLLFDVSENDRLELFPTPRGIEEAQHALATAPRKEPASPRVLIHPGCGSDGKPREWPLEKYSVLINWLQKKYVAQIFLTGGPEEKRKTANLNRLIGRQGVDLGGKLSWEGTVSILADMDLVISGNTGVMHLAAALQKPQVALHGPTNEILWGPLNPKARVVKTPCEKCPCLRLGFEYHAEPLDCMNKIDVEQVKQAVASLI